MQAVPDGESCCSSIIWWFGAESGLLVLAERGLLIPALESALEFLPRRSVTRLNFGRTVPRVVAGFNTYFKWWLVEGSNQ